MKTKFPHDRFLPPLTVLILCLICVFATAQENSPTVPNLTVECEIVDDCHPMGVAISTRVHFDHPAPGHEYAIRYQLRLLQDRQLDGPILGNLANPNGAAFDLDQSIGKRRALYGNFNLAGAIDISREKLREMTNLPKDLKSEDILIGFQPEVYDLTEMSYLTNGENSPVMFVVHFNSEGRLSSVTGLYEWIVGFRPGLEGTRYDSRQIDRLTQLVGHIGKVRASKSVLPFAFNDLLEGLTIPDDKLLAILNSIQPEWVVIGKLGLESNLAGTIEAIQNSNSNPQIKDRIDALLSGGVIE